MYLHNVVRIIIFPSVPTSTFPPNYLLSPFINKTFGHQKSTNDQKSVCILSAIYFCLLFWPLQIFLLKFPPRTAFPGAEVGHLSGPCNSCLLSVFIFSKPKYFRSKSKTSFSVLVNYYYCGWLWSYSLQCSTCSVKEN